MTPQQQVDDWNTKHPIGTRVIYKMSGGELITKTSQPACLLMDVPFIYVVGHPGPCWLNQVTPHTLEETDEKTNTRPTAVSKVNK